MGIFSEISKIEKLRDARMEAGRSGRPSPEASSPGFEADFG